MSAGSAEQTVESLQKSSAERLALNAFDALRLIMLFADRAQSLVSKQQQQDYWYFFALLMYDARYGTTDPAVWWEWIKIVAGKRDLLSTEQMRQDYPNDEFLVEFCRNDILVDHPEVFQLMISYLRAIIGRYHLVGLIEVLKFLDPSWNDLPLRDDLWEIWSR